MTTEVRWRGLTAWRGEMFDSGHIRTVLDSYDLRNEPFSASLRKMQMYVGESRRWDTWIADPAGVAAYDNDHPHRTKPYAVYPTWRYEDPIADLAMLLESPVGEDKELCYESSIPRQVRPRFGQQHIVFAYGFPDVSSGVGRRALRIVRDLQANYPDSVIHIHGLNVLYNALFGMGFKSVDVDLAPSSSKKLYLVLPNGRTMDTSPEGQKRLSHWITMLGFSFSDLSQSGILAYNIKSVLWAAENFNKEKLYTVKPVAQGPDAPMSKSADTTKRFVGREPRSREGDKVTCDTCSLADYCKSYRAEAVCSIPNTSASKMAAFFKTRDSNQIIDGLSELISVQAVRLERGLSEEEEMNELDSEVTKIIDGMFDKGVRLAKLVNPALGAGPKVGVFVGTQGQTAVASGSDQKRLVSQVVQELEMRGIPRSEITPEMLTGVLAPNKQLIEATAITHDPTAIIGGGDDGRPC